jgi:hypothetical protein
MSLFILQNDNYQIVYNNLRKICPDPNLSADLGVSFDPNLGVNVAGSGAITYSSPSMSSVGCQMVLALAASNVIIGIRGETDVWSDRPAANRTLHNIGGTTVYDKYPTPTLIEIVYDVHPCNDLGFWVTDENGTHITVPLDVALFHEMAHALDMVNGTYSQATTEPKALTAENAYRSSMGLPTRYGHVGGCIQPQPQPAPPQSSNCFIATAAFGSAIAPEVQALRSFRDDVLRKTRAGARFFDEFWRVYYQVSPFVVNAMNEDPDVREMVRWSIVTPIIRYLDLILQCPDEPATHLPEPWASFCSGLQQQLESWTSEITLPRNFGAMETHEVASEIGIVLRYVLRSEDHRSDYLDELQQLGEIPIVGSSADLQAASFALSAMGLSQQLVERIVGNATEYAVRSVSPYYMNSDEFTPATSLPDAGNWIYQIAIINLSGSQVDQIALFYSQSDIPNAVVGIAADTIPPGAVVTFSLCPCNLLQSYAIGFFVNNPDGTSTEIAQIPNSDPMFQGQLNVTPALDRQLHPTDPPCVSGWELLAGGSVK